MYGSRGGGRVSGTASRLKHLCCVAATLDGIAQDSAGCQDLGRRCATLHTPIRDNGTAEWVGAGASWVDRRRAKAQDGKDMVSVRRAKAGAALRAH